MHTHHRASALLTLILLGTTALSALQGDPVIGWLTRLQGLQHELGQVEGDAGPEVERIAATLAALRREIAARQDAVTGLTLPDRIPGWNRSALNEELTGLRAALEQQQRSLPGSAFQLARMEVNVTADLPQISTADSLDEMEYRKRNLGVLTDALELVPGVSVQRIGPRNERGVFIRGFDVRQAPLYVDGIPVYVPYDGYVDMDRFLTFDVGEMEVAKGFSSPLYGPNALGGAINLITKAPSKPLTLDLGTGYGSGREVNAFSNVGVKWKNYWAQGGFAWLSSDTFPLSGSFRPVPLQNNGDRQNAGQRDDKGRVRFGWTPNARDQYTFTYANQQGRKDNPPYAGTDPLVRARFWQWPQWDKKSYYFAGNKGLGEASYLRARVYYDRFDNLLQSFDTSCYCTQSTPRAFNSPFDDDTFGTTLEFGTRAGRRQTVKSSLYFKDDTHREGNTGEPMRSFRDQSFSFGFEDTIRISERASVIAGFSADHLRVLNAQNLVRGAVEPFPRNQVWAFNPQAGLFHTLSEATKLHFSFARKTRLPTIKDRYSYRLGQAIPNPDLLEERTNNWEAGLTHLLGRRTLLQASLFRSDVSNSVQRFFLQPNLFQFRNLGEARFLGGEASVRSSLTARLDFQMNYTYLSRRNMTEPGLLMIDTPRHKIHSALTCQLGPRLTLMADLGYEGGRFYQNEGGRFGRATNFARAGLGASARLSRQLELQTGLHNALDRNYFLVEGYPEAGRTAYVNLRYRF
jgi:iron complex outermembrane receptor protein